MTDWRIEIGGYVREGSDLDLYPSGSIQITPSQLGLEPIEGSLVPCLFYCEQPVRICDCPADSPGLVGFSDWNLAAGADPYAAVPDGPWVSGLLSCE